MWQITVIYPNDPGFMGFATDDQHQAIWPHNDVLYNKGACTSIIPLLLFHLIDDSLNRGATSGVLQIAPLQTSIQFRPCRFFLFVYLIFCSATHYLK